MSLLMPQIAARMFNTPLMMDEGKAAAMLAGLGGRIVEGGVVVLGGDALNVSAPYMGKVGDKLGQSYDRANIKTYEVMNGVAVIPIEGTLVHKGAYLGQSSGETSYQGLQTQIARATVDPAVKGVVFEVDSFGGQVAGAFETADMLAALSAAKPTMAILTDFALSAGYLMASAARQIVIPPLGAAGSIGVITLHADFSKKLENEGIKVTIIAAGERKADMHPALALSPEALAAAKARVEDARQIFAETVGRNRGDRFSKSDALKSEAAIYDGRAAVKAGLADAVGKSHDAFAAFVKAVNRA